MNTSFLPLPAASSHHIWTLFSEASVTKFILTHWSPVPPLDLLWTSPWSWSLGPAHLAHWSSGLLVLWSSGLLVPWSSGLLVLDGEPGGCRSIWTSGWRPVAGQCAGFSSSGLLTELRDSQKQDLRPEPTQKNKNREVYFVNDLERKITKNM